MFTRINTPQLASGKTYTLSAKVRFDEGTTGAIDKLRLVYRTSPGERYYWKQIVQILQQMM